ncbi:MAG: lasso peptide biosynthesis B2 protein [Deltaproteobacteria bacterium]|nr:lasso peptide biosynthesis B2 protein [Deltaproteobacteria bacterium]
MTRIDRLRELCTLRNWPLYVQILIWMSVVRILVNRMEIRAVLNRLDRRRTARRPLRDADIERAWIGRRFVDLILIRLLKSATPCLVQSLTLFHLFRRRGLDVGIVFGVQKNTSPLKGHSWILINGETPLEPAAPEASCVTLFSYP